jgi:methyltransferase family protein
LHPSALDFGGTALEPGEIAGQLVIESGALDVNGSVRPAIEARGPARYIGTDMRPGPGVDVVCAAEHLPVTFGYNTAGVVITMEMLEHAEDWQAAMTGLIHVLAPGGPLVITTRSEGAGYHAHPGDFWRFSVPAMTGILQSAGLQVERCEPDPENPGVFAKARKPRNWMWHGTPPAWTAAGGVTPMPQPA